MRHEGELPRAVPAGGAEGAVTASGDTAGEFEVDDIEAATMEFEDGGYDLLVRVREELWGQVLTRFLAPGGLMVGIVRNT